MGKTLYLTKPILFVLAANVTSFDHHPLDNLAAFLISLVERWDNIGHCAFSSLGIPRAPVLRGQVAVKDRLSRCAPNVGSLGSGTSDVTTTSPR